MDILVLSNIYRLSGFLDGKHEISLKTRCACYNDDSLSDQLWVMYCPKGAISKNHMSVKHRDLSVSFHGYIHDKPVKVKKCAVHFIYKPRINDTR